MFALSAAILRLVIVYLCVCVWVYIGCVGCYRPRLATDRFGMSVCGTRVLDLLLHMVCEYVYWLCSVLDERLVNGYESCV